jgi:biopolymer transport protein ExbD
MRKSAPRSRKEPTIALINIVFLMLVFFMVTGTLSPSLDRDITLVETAEMEGREPPDALVIDNTGQLRHRGVVLTSVAAFFDRPDSRARDVVRLLPDRDLPAVDLLRVSAQLRAQGVERIMISTQRALR